MYLQLTYIIAFLQFDGKVQFQLSRPTWIAKIIVQVEILNMWQELLVS